MSKRCVFRRGKSGSGLHVTKTKLGLFVLNLFKHLQRGESKKAIEVFESVRRSHKTKCGDVEYILSTLIYMVGLICLYTSDYDGALANFRDSTKLRSSVLDSSHKDVLVSLCTLSYQPSTTLLFRVTHMSA